jgi:hypothetical protein
VGCLAALSAACAANFFSSIQYNGVLVVFVFVLALVGSIDIRGNLGGRARNE